jgi:hypothetical protein
VQYKPNDGKRQDDMKLIPWVLWAVVVYVFDVLGLFNEDEGVRDGDDHNGGF